ncbi:MAG: hypothetical protein KJP00_07220 [Bacteroidia bacterium]|nr:hypothetical protein [Bacteroidia bacterium]
MRLELIFILIAAIAGFSQPVKSQSSSFEESNATLIAILDTIWITEQEPIRLRDSLGRVHGFESEAFQKQNEIYHKNHAINEKKIITILESEGWPSKDVIGERGAITICNVIQHSDNEIRLRYLPMMKEAVRKKELQPRLLARAEDRIATERGDLQIYGGQIKYYPETKNFDVWPILDPENIDKRRAQIGLEPIAQFLRTRRNPIEWNLEEQIKRTEEFKAKRDTNK